MHQYFFCIFCSCVVLILLLAAVEALPSDVDAVMIHTECCSRVFADGRALGRREASVPLEKNHRV